MMLIHCGDCLKIMPTLDENSIDAIVTDPPYGLSFMGKDWDHGVPGEHFWREALRIAKPGAHLLAFGGTRTFHRLTCSIEDAGWEIRDCIMWVYGSGFPKSLDVSKAIDKAAGAERDVIKIRKDGNKGGGAKTYDDDAYVWKETFTETAPATDAARQWSGWGTALKPAWEPIILARKPLDGTVAGNVQKYGTGGMNIDGGRVGAGGGTAKGNPPKLQSNGIYGNGINGACDILDIGNGRWPANFIHDGSEEVLAGMGAAARFFYCAKASKRERDAGCEGLPEVKAETMSDYVHPSEGRTADKNGGPKHNFHPTVKPTDLMRYLCRLVTPPGGVVLDPFMGSGSTGKAAVLEGFEFVGIELNAEYCQIARARIEAAGAQMRMAL